MVQKFEGEHGWPITMGERGGTLRLDKAQKPSAEACSSECDNDTDDEREVIRARPGHAATSFAR